MDTNVITPAVQLDGLTISFPSHDGSAKTVVDNLDLTIPRGQFVSLVGRSGCGKTTLLNALAGLGGRNRREDRGPRHNAIRRSFSDGLHDGPRCAVPVANSAEECGSTVLELRGVPKAERTNSIRALACGRIKCPRRHGLWDLATSPKGCASVSRWPERGLWIRTSC